MLNNEGHKPKTQNQIYEVRSALHLGFLTNRRIRAPETRRKHTGSTPTLWAQTELERFRLAIQLSPMWRRPQRLQPSPRKRHRTSRLLHTFTSQRTIPRSPSGKPHFFRNSIPPRPHPLHYPKTQPKPRILRPITRRPNPPK